MFLARLTGLSLGAVAVGSVLYEAKANPILWVLLATNALVWPVIAYRLTMGAKFPTQQERSNLVLDSAFGGAWIAAMHGALLPSVLLIAMLAMDKMAFGGWKLLARALGAQFAAALAAGMLTGYAFDLHLSLPVVIACIPHLLLYPLIVSSSANLLLRLSNRQRQQITEMARTDQLSGLLNRGHWEQRTAVALADLRRGTGASLVLIDIDHFKRINDRHGHLVGDQMIRGVAETIRRLLRERDFAARYGGDEFVMVLPLTPIEDALRLADQLQVAIGVETRALGLTSPLTVSVGVAAMDAQTQSVDDWIARADVALYQAKARGRALIVAA